MNKSQATKLWNTLRSVLLADDGRTVYQKAIALGRTYSSCKSRRSRLMQSRSLDV